MLSRQPQPAAWRFKMEDITITITHPANVKEFTRPAIGKIVSWRKGCDPVTEWGSSYMRSHSHYVSVTVRPGDIVDYRNNCSKQPQFGMLSGYDFYAVEQDGSLSGLSRDEAFARVQQSL
jgi:hypothetical protein